MVTWGAPQVRMLDALSTAERSAHARRLFDTLHHVLAMPLSQVVSDAAAANHDNSAAATEGGAVLLLRRLVNAMRATRFGRRVMPKAQQFSFLNDTLLPFVAEHGSKPVHVVLAKLHEGGGRRGILTTTNLAAAILCLAYGTLNYLCWACRGLSRAQLVACPECRACRDLPRFLGSTGVITADAAATYARVTALMAQGHPYGRTRKEAAHMAWFHAVLFVAFGCRLPS
ncbi:hypothetical protein COO60DRAFT_1643861 [Scenedesmus sp. NREL 46B-D3]|nr:hypothetical protein COO60DRAFT_1643861 [Scenedesmus sp. NREL 46B-D3]